MTSDSTLTAGDLYLIGSSRTTLGGTNNFDNMYVGSDMNSSLTLLISGASVEQGGIATVKDQVSVVNYDSTSYPDCSVTGTVKSSITPITSVEFDLDSITDYLGSVIYLIKESDDYYDFGDGLVIDGTARDVSEDWIHFTKTTDDGQTYDFDYIYDGKSLRFGNTETVINDPDIDDSDLNVDTTSEIISRLVQGEVVPESDHGHTIFTPNTQADDPISYVVAEGLNDGSDFSMATTGYLKETTTTWSDDDGNVVKTEVSVDDLGIDDLDLYVNATDAVISGGTVGLDSSETGTETGDEVTAMVNNVIVKNDGSLTLDSGNVTNADRTLKSDDGTIELDNATLNIGGGDLSKFRDNEEILGDTLDWDSLTSSSITDSEVTLNNGSEINFNKVDDDQVPTTLAIDNSTLELNDASSMNIGDGVDTTITDSTVDLNSGSSLNFTGPEDLVIDNSTLELDDSSSINVGEGVKTTITDSTIDLSNGSSMNLAQGNGDVATIDHSTIELSENSSLNGSKSGDMTVTNSTISGKGSVSNFTSKDNTYIASKDSAGVLELKNIQSYSDTMSASIFGPRVVSGAYNSDATEGTGVVSQLKITDGTTITNGNFQLAVIGDSSLMTEGSSFQVLDLDAPLVGGFTSFTETGTPLMDGYAWDYSLLNSQGIVSIILTELGDGARVANTMYSSAKTVSYASQVAMDHLYNYYAGQHDFHAEGNNFWVSSLGTYQCVANRNGRTGYTYQSMGYAVGYDRAVGDHMIEGLSFGQTWGKNTPKSGTNRYSAGKIDQDAVVGTLYGLERLMASADGQNQFFLEHYVSYGSVSNKSTKTALFNNKTATAKWDDDVWSFGLRGVWNRQLNEHWAISPFVGVEYEHVSQENFTERMGNNTAHYNGGSYQNLDVSVGTAASYHIAFKNGMELTPTASVAYVGSVVRDAPKVDVSNGTGKSVRESAVNTGRSAFQASAGVNWKISQDWNMSANYDFYVAQGTTAHNANVTVSYAF
jgi:outer membrane autotransporter protein